MPERSCCGRRGRMRGQVSLSLSWVCLAEELVMGTSRRTLCPRWADGGWPIPARFRPERPPQGHCLDVHRGSNPHQATNCRQTRALARAGSMEKVESRRTGQNPGFSMSICEGSMFRSTAPKDLLIGACKCTRLNCSRRPQVPAQTSTASQVHCSLACAALDGHAKHQTRGFSTRRRPFAFPPHRSRQKSLGASLLVDSKAFNSTRASLAA